ncbi:hypothetical protein V7S43_008521 [Phytophthora oleae]|uniref:No apical meristem-associated C-terminal domain-containing protein n=1 Tax=Phytophthora oleae TaxID=2107226 RepID=A0ABD3FH65_9STRA
MEAIFGVKANIKPASTVELGIPVGIATRRPNECVDPAAQDDRAVSNVADISTCVGADYDNTGGDMYDSDASTDYGESIGQKDDEEFSDDTASKRGVPDGVNTAGTAGCRMDGTAATSDDLNDILPLDLGVPNADLATDNGVLEAVKSAPRGLVEALFGISSSEESEDEENQSATPVGTKSRTTKSASKTAKQQKTASNKVAGKKRSSVGSNQTGKKGGGKQTRMSAHQKNLSIVESHLEVSLKKQEMQHNFLYDQLEFNKQKWIEEKADKEGQPQLARERLEKETVARKSSESHEFFLELVKQDKSSQEIKDLLQINDNGDLYVF